jgi:TPR repeat protein
MPLRILSCASLPPATISSVPIYDYAISKEGLAEKATETYYSCCGKSICYGCVHSFCKSGNDEKCPFCNSDRAGKTDEEQVEEMMKRVEVNDAASIYMLAGFYCYGLNGLQQDHAKAIELYVRAANLGYSTAHNNLGVIYQKGGYLKKAKSHVEAAAMLGNEAARHNIGCLEAQSRNMERAMKHFTIGASAGDYKAMHELITLFKQGHVSRESMDSTLVAYNNSCAEMRSEARDAYIRVIMGMTNNT